MHARGTWGRGGFTLIELLVVFAVIVVIAAMMIPLFLNAMHRAKQRRTMAEMHLAGKAMMSWVTDQVAAGAAGADATISITDYGLQLSPAQLASLLEPTYMAQIPRVDGWQKSFDYRLQENPQAAQRLAGIRSAGRDGVFGGDTYTASPFDPNEFEQDLVWVDGFFVRWPERTAN
ncbi:MAG TPA: prepilin-type N-terminal cleavage/methylation domain-containing protein [Thermoanaerobaculia bacterium]|nr:prepilin-type N-terminal cleavage/methylation domain-containing protein [Thermoanaerobaculia bacterium]